jgi:hypothetical protein
MCNERYANEFNNQPPTQGIHHLGNMVKDSSEYNIKFWYSSG